MSNRIKSKGVVVGKMGVSCVGVGSSLLGKGSLEDIENLAREFKKKIA